MIDSGASRSERVYLDHAATAPMPQSVLDAYTRALSVLGNPASTHGHGQSASDELEGARERVAGTLGCDPAEVVFTGGGTESINLALKGLYWARRRQGAGPVLLIAEGEHHATLEAAQWLADEQGAELVWVPIDAAGALRPDVLEDAISRVGGDRVALVSFLWANNEVGTVQPVAALSEVARNAGIPVHIDAVAALGQLPIDFRASGAAALSLSAHKIGGPPGVGALVLGREATAQALLHGGSQQRSRAGTQNVAGAVAFAAALELAYSEGFPMRMERMARLRDDLIRGVLERVPDAVLSGVAVDEPGAPGGSEADHDASWHARLAGNAHFTFPGCQGDSLVYLLDAAGISASVGSACQAGVSEISHVLLAMGMAPAQAAGSLRFTLGPETSRADIDALLQVLPDAVRRARAAGLSG